MVIISIVGDIIFVKTESVTCEQYLNKTAILLPVLKRLP